MILVHYAKISEAVPLSRPCWDSLNLADRARALQIRRPIERKQFVAARYLLRLALAKLLNEEVSSFSFIPNKNGKLELLNASEMLKDKGQLDFSLSHSHGAVAAVVSTEGRVGLDVELFQSIDPEAIQVAFTGAELEKLASFSSSERERLCIEAWGAKEATAKLLGCPDHLDISSLPHVQRGAKQNATMKSWALEFGCENYHLCLAYDGSAKTDILLREETA